MAYLILFFALLAAVAAGALFYLDHKQRRSAEVTDRDVSAGEDQTPAAEEPAELAEPVAEDDIIDAEIVEDEEAEEAKEAEVDEPVSGADKEARGTAPESEPESVAEAAPAQPKPPVEPKPEVKPEPPVGPEPEVKPEPVTEPAPAQPKPPVEPKPEVKPEPVTEVKPEPVAETAPAPKMKPEPPVEPKPEVKPEPESMAEAAPAQPEPQSKLEPQPEQQSKSKPKPESEPEPEPAPEPEPDPEPAPEPAPEPEPDPEPAKIATAHRSSGLHLPGSTRRERRAWAEEKGYEFTRQDAFLIDEWHRGAAATGAPARDIVSGWTYQHEMLLMDLDGVNVMAMRTGGGSDIVVDFRRNLPTSAEKDSEDLVEVGEVAGFVVFGTDAGVVERLIDIRVTTALELMPEPVTAVWMESDWVLAQTVRGTRAEDWEAMLAPLALLADAARVLPPAGGVARVLPLGDFTPSRRMMDPPERVLEPPAPDEQEHRDRIEMPLVLRPDEPLELPSRTRPRAKGVVEPRAVGADEVDAIADGRPVASGSDDTRVLRKLDGRSVIFDDRASDSEPEE